MKKIITILISVLMALSLNGCANSKEKEVSLINPVKELSSLDELSKIIDMALYKYEANNIKEESYRLIAGEYQIAEYEFKQDDKTFTIRASKAPCSIDITGIYTSERTLFGSYLEEEGTVYIENDDYLAARWFTVDGQYVAFVDVNEWDFNSFDETLTSTKNVKPLNWNSDVAYEDYLNICGYYASENYDMASISIKGNCAQVILTISKDAGTLIYEMNAELKDGKLVFDEVSVEYSVFNDETFESEVQELPSLGEGSITLGDKQLSFENSNILEAKDILMTYFEF